MWRTIFRAPSFSNHRLTVYPLNSRPSSFSRSDTCPFVNARLSEFIARSAAAFVGVSSDGRPLRGLFERSSSWVSSICALQFFHSVVGYSRPTP